MIQERSPQHENPPSLAHEPPSVGPVTEPPSTDLSSPVTPKQGMNHNAQIYQPKSISRSSTEENIVLKLIEAQDRQSLALQKKFEQQQQGVVALTLPQQALQIYDGNPTRYHEWIRSFENLIETKTQNPGARLYYLVQYTSGHVKELMRSCLTMRDDLGYSEARRLLHERYGQSNRVATAIIQNMIHGPPIKGEDADALQQLSVQLTSGANTLIEIGHISKFDNPDNLRRIIERLPFRIGVQWRDEVDRIFQRERRDVNVQDIVVHPKSTQQPAQSTSDGAQVAGVAANQEQVAAPILEVLPNQPSNSAANGFIDSSKSFSATGLAVVPVKVRIPGHTEVIETYAFLDNGSNATCCVDQLLTQLGVHGKSTDLSLTTLQGKEVPTKCTVTSLEILDLSEENLVELPTVFSTPQLPISKNDIATKTDMNRWQHFKGIELPVINADIGLLIGSNVPAAMQPQELRVGKKGEPYATRTIFGWTINGPLGRKIEGKKHSANFVKADWDLNRQFEKFCNMDFQDSSPDSQAVMSRNDQIALQIMEETSQLNDGHYELALPWKTYPPYLPNNKPMAKHRADLLKRRLEKDVSTYEKYKTFIGDLITKGYARKVPESDLDPSTPAWYLPHHPVYHPQKPGKLRVVFDCAAKWHGTSLNDQLLHGPALTQSLVGVLLRFRQEPVALMSDIEAMFHQVKVRAIDSDYLRFLWWPGGDLGNEPQDYQMTVHLFGATSSPSGSNFALKKTALDNSSDFSHETVQTVLHNFYVDDCLKSLPTTNDAIQLSTELRELLARGGFRLTKWLSNDQEVLETIPESERATSVKALDFDNSLSERALGVQWNIQADTLGFNISVKDKPVTRRGILAIDCQRRV